MWYMIINLKQYKQYCIYILFFYKIIINGNGNGVCWNFWVVGLKIILLDQQKNYIKNSSMMSNVIKNFDQFKRDD